MNHSKLAEELFDCLNVVKSVEPLTTRFPNISIDDAYQISLELMALREAAGEKIIGKKIGVTSKGVQDMLGVYQPDYGFLTNKMLCESQKVITSKLILPRAEAEIAFKLNQTLTGPNVTAEDVLNATEYVTPAIEVVDSRIKDWEIKIEDTIADNASCGLFVVGKEQVDPHTLDLEELEVTFAKNGETESIGKGSEVMGNPLNAVAWLANKLGEAGVSLNAGEIILSGSMVPLAPAIKGDTFTMYIEGLGSCTVVFV